MITFTEEKKFGHIIVGVDEVGRGPLAGPVTAAAVRLNNNFLSHELNDSKKLSKKNREKIFREIITHSQFAISFSSVEEIDRYNILQASLLAMKRAVESLNIPNATILVDGKFTFDKNNKNIKTFISGDQVYPSIAAASIVAKVIRDRYMELIGKKFEVYDWGKNSGYGTKNHLLALNKFGATPFHRKSFSPVHKILFKK
ncbi:MAG: ribonuclease HII [Pelagibacteraceae bacterium]